MSEKPLDLNALRQQSLEKGQVLVSKEDRIAELKANIEELEGNPKIEALHKFMELSPEEQLAEINRVIKNRNLASGSYTVEDRKAELSKTDSDFLDITVPIRLETYRAELAKLESES